MSTATVTVTGMTCSCCTSKVSKEVGKIAGVTGVDIDLESGLVTVDSEAPVGPEALAEAVGEAGYEITK